MLVQQIYVACFFFHLFSEGTPNQLETAQFANRKMTLSLQLAMYTDILGEMIPPTKFGGGQCLWFLVPIPHSSFHPSLSHFLSFF